MFDKTEYQRNYRKENLKRVSFDLPKEKKDKTDSRLCYEVIKAAADHANESVNGYIKKAIELRMKKDKK